MNGQVDLALADAVDLQPMKPFGCVSYTASFTRSSIGWPFTHVWIRGPFATIGSLFHPSSMKCGCPSSIFSCDDSQFVPSASP
jgi:hypothetical protein